jgi:hypothetical protein
MSSRVSRGGGRGMARDAAHGSGALVEGKAASG